MKHNSSLGSILSLFLQRLFFVAILSTLLASCESRRIIVNNLDEKEANEILVYLSNKRVDAIKVPASAEGAGGGAGKATMWNISVQSAQANEAMAYLNQVGLPRRRGQNLLGIFSNSTLVPSGMQEKIRYQAGLAEQIASTIRKIDGILDADVQLSFPEEDPLNPSAVKQKPTASVFVIHTGVLDDPNAHLVNRIKRLVAGSVNNLDYDHVTVLGDKSRASEPLIGTQEERPFVNVWSIIVARDSLTRFRLFFFSFTIIILILLLTLFWLLWKLMPLISQSGGLKSLFTLHPLEISGETPPAASKEGTEGEQSASEKSEPPTPSQGSTKK